MIQYLISFGLSQSEAVIFTFSIITFIIGTTLRILFNIINSRKDRDSREKEWKFKIYNEFFGELDNNVSLISTEFFNYIYNFALQLYSIQNADDFRNEDYILKAKQFSYNINQAMKNVLQYKERIFLFFNNPNINDAITSYVNSVLELISQYKDLSSIQSITDLIGKKPEEIVNYFASKSSDSIKKSEENRINCYKLIRKDLGMK